MTVQIMIAYHKNCYLNAANNYKVFLFNVMITFFGSIKVPKDCGVFV